LIFYCNLHVKTSSNQHVFVCRKIHNNFYLFIFQCKIFFTFCFTVRNKQYLFTIFIKRFNTFVTNYNQILYVIRNPKDQAVSWYNFIMQFPFTKNEPLCKLYPQNERDFYNIFLTGEACNFFVFNQTNLVSDLRLVSKMFFHALYEKILIYVLFNQSNFSMLYCIFVFRYRNVVFSFLSFRAELLCLVKYDVFLKIWIVVEY